MYFYIVLYSNNCISFLYSIFFQEQLKCFVIMFTKKIFCTVQIKNMF